jgi:hypothetical protein
MTASGGGLVLAGVLGLSPAGLASQAGVPSVARGLQVTHDGVSCVVAGRYPQIQARVEPAGGAGRVRVHFRAEASAAWYFVEMRTTLDGWVGVLPKPLPSLRRFRYYVEATGTSFESSRTAEHAPRVMGRQAECEARALVAPVSAIGPAFVGVPAGAPPVPVGFAAVNPATVAAGASGAAASAGGLSGGAIAGIALGGAAVVGGAVALAGGKSGGSPAASGASGGGTSAPGGSGGSARVPQALTLALSNNCSLTGGGVTIYAGDTVTVARGMCNWLTLPEAQAATAGQTATITVDGVPLQPVRYLVSFSTVNNLACAVADADWKATAGRHLASGVWTIPGTPVHTCEMSVQP